MRTIVYWIPAAFCALISFLALLESIGIHFFVGSTGYIGWWQPVFFAFLPMCFFFVGVATTHLHRELRELKQRVAELEQNTRRV